MAEKKLEYAWRTDRGKVRTLNEDAIGVHPESGLVIIADGIGGANAGEIASRLAVRILWETFQKYDKLPATPEEAAERLNKSVLEANRVIYFTGTQTPRYAGMGTTVVTGYFCPDWTVFSHVGDSRLYLWRDQQLHQLTRDHSLIQEVVDQGFFSSIADAQRYGIRQNILTRGLGSANQVLVDTDHLELVPGDLFLFCTDGLSGMVSEADLKTALREGETGALEALCDRLISLAHEGGGLDNITVALVRLSVDQGADASQEPAQETDQD